MNIIKRILWKSKKCPWNLLMVTYGIRNSEIPQYLPVWNMSNNNSRSVMVGFQFWFFQITYHKRGKSFQMKWFYKYLPYKEHLWHTYNLFL